MYSTAFWCLFVVLLVFWLYCVTTDEGSNREETTQKKNEEQ